MNWPLQVSTDCLVLHVHLQSACIHRLMGLMVPHKKQTRAKDRNDQAVSVGIQKKHKSKQL